MAKSNASAKTAQETEAIASKEDFEPTHGRSPEVIKEMIQARRATDVVPDPEDIQSGHPENSPEDKEHGRSKHDKPGAK